MRPSCNCRTIRVAITLALYLLAVRSAVADVFLLQNGGRVRGHWANGSQRSPQRLVIETPQGVRVTLDRSQVRQTIRQPASLDQYEQLAARWPDTVEAHWKLAEWCAAHHLPKQRQWHLRRILALEPDHAGARRGLGYSQVGGRWVTREEVLQERGYELYEGHWRLRQEIDLLEAERRLDQAEREWQTQLMRWREMLGTEKSNKAIGNIRGVRDPHAVKALARLLAREPDRRVKMLYVEALGQIDDRSAIGALFEASLRDADEEIFHACVDQIVRRNPPHMAERYAELLKDSNNVRVNRAAHALGRLGDKSVVSPLIDALITTHYIVIPADSGRYTTSFMKPTAAAGAPGSTAFSAGEQTKRIPRTVGNQEVLQALVKLGGGVNFGFDRRAWHSWLASERQRAGPAVNGRRDRR